MRQVALIGLPKALGSAITIPLEMLNAANDIALARGQRESRLDIKFVSDTLGTIRLAGGLEVNCNTSLKDIQQADLIFIPGIWGNPAGLRHKYKPLTNWLESQLAGGATLCAIVTGSHILAQAGILDHRAATTHWRFFDQFQAQFPNVRLERKRFITYDNGIYCTGSVNAVRDLMLHFIDQYFGESITNEVSRHFTHELKRSYESLVLKQNLSSSHHDEEIIKIQEWLGIRYLQEINFEELAASFGMSRRSLNRRFKQATSLTPVNYLQELKLQQAKTLLKESNLTVAQVADQVSISDCSYFSSLFKKKNSVTPMEYRRLVRSKLFKVVE
ncbi:MAG: transcriptional regulator GlxA family with amidase domain [Pseudohongiellaceae bacterium]|jgi:transcriptional regulator GlxA family with amidase domain